jgi:hypothetical protein
MRLGERFEKMYSDISRPSIRTGTPAARAAAAASLLHSKRAPPHRTARLQPRALTVDGIVQKSQIEFVRKCVALVARLTEPTVRHLPHCFCVKDAGNSCMAGHDDRRRSNVDPKRCRSSQRGDLDRH